MFSGVYFHRPVSWLGQNLSTRNRKVFEAFRNSIYDYTHAKIPQGDKLLCLVDGVDNLGLKNDYDADTFAILDEVVNYLRILLLSSNPTVVINTINLCDSFVKNCGTKMHLLIGRKLFLRTLSVISRRWLHWNVAVAMCGLDAIQGWGEGFESRQHLFPLFTATYLHLRGKSYISFPRQQYDPNRVPIFLGPITQREKALVDHFGSDQNECNMDMFDSEDRIDESFSKNPPMNNNSNAAAGQNTSGSFDTASNVSNANKPPPPPPKNKNASYNILDVDIGQTNNNAKILDYLPNDNLVGFSWANGNSLQTTPQNSVEPKFSSFEEFFPTEKKKVESKTTDGDDYNLNSTSTQTDTSAYDPWDEFDKLMIDMPLNSQPEVTSSVGGNSQDLNIVNPFDLFASTSNANAGTDPADGSANRNSIKLKDVDHDYYDNPNHAKFTTVVNDISTNQPRPRSRRLNKNYMPSSDPNNEVKFYGGQRVVLRKEIAH